MYSSLFAALALSVGAPAAKDGKNDPPSLVGVWVAEKGTTGGEEWAIAAGSMTIEFTTDGKLNIQEGSKRSGLLDCRTDPKRSPAEIDFVAPPKAKCLNMVGIYQVDGDTLTLCPGPGGKRPTRFKSAAGSDVMLLTPKRPKPKD
jgi:uncharacterized protein (TIGR03067 family)